MGIVKKDHYEIIKRKAWLKCKKYFKFRYFFNLIKASGWFDWNIWRPVFNILDEAPVERVYFSTFLIM